MLSTWFRSALALALVLFSGSIWSQSSPASATSPAASPETKPGVLRVGFPEGPLSGRLDPATGLLKGYSAEIVRVIFQEAHKEWTPVLLPAMRLPSELLAGRVDILLTSFPPEGVKGIRLVAPLLDSTILLMSPKAAPIHSIQELEGKRLGIARGLELPALQNNPKIVIQQVRDNLALIQMIRLGRVDAIAGARLPLSAALKAMGYENNMDPDPLVLQRLQFGLYAAAGTKHPDEDSLVDAIHRKLTQKDVLDILKSAMQED